MRQILKKCRLFILYTCIFSVVLNILALAPIIYMLSMFDRVLNNGSIATLIMLTLIVVLASVLGAFLDTIQSSLLNRFSITLHRLLGQPVLKNILALKYQDGQTRHGMEDVVLLQNFIITKAVKALFDLPWIPIYIVILYFFHPALALCALAAIIVLLLLAIWENKATKNTQLHVGKASREVADFLTGTFRNTEIITASGMQSVMSKRWWLKNENYLTRKNNVENKVAGIHAFTSFVRHIISALSLAIAAYLVVTENLSIGVMIASTMFIGKAMAPISSVITAGKAFVDARGAYARLNALLVDDRAETSIVDMPPLKGQLAVDNISFSIMQDRKILSALSFSLEPGECLAVIGSSASGKTTLAKILTGYYKPTNGNAYLDGTEIDLWSKNGLGKMIGYLPQDIQLFSGTVAENIARLEPVQENQANIIAAAKQAHVHEMILKLPEGYDTDIGERGAKLSGGQRQRLGIARALYGNPQFVVLDEPNSNLDGQSELELLEIIKELKRNQVTVVVISHKPNLVEIADKVLALHEGALVKFGARLQVLKQIRLT